MMREEEAVYVYGVLSDRQPHTVREIAEECQMTVCQARYGLAHLRRHLGNDVVVCKKQGQLSTHRLANGALEVAEYGEQVLKGVRTQIRLLMELVDVAHRNNMFPDRRRSQVRQVGSMLQAAFAAVQLTAAEGEDADEVIGASRAVRGPYAAQIAG